MQVVHNNNNCNRNYALLTLINPIYHVLATLFKVLNSLI